MQQEAFIKKYVITKFDNVIEVSISRKAIQIKNSNKNMLLCISILRSWRGKQFLVSDVAFEKMTVLHKCVMKSEFRMFQHLTDAIQTILSNILEDDIFLFYAGLLSLKSHSSIISKQFQKIWQNKIILYHYKMGKYTIRRNLLSSYAVNHVMIPIYDTKIRRLQDLIQLEKKMVV
jgi:hypothetical protein